MPRELQEYTEEFWRIACAWRGRPTRGVVTVETACRQLGIIAQGRRPIALPGRAQALLDEIVHQAKDEPGDAVTTAAL
jgi:hypothetical protein